MKKNNSMLDSVAYLKKLPEVCPMYNHRETYHIEYFDFLRVLASFAVVTLHVASDLWRSVPVSAPAWTWLNFYDSISRWGVPVFTMISGALFLSRSEELPVAWKRIFRKSLRLILVFFSWAFIYAGISFLLGRTTSLDKWLTAIIQGQNYMWFLPMIAGLYLISPLLRRLVEKPELMRYFLIIALVFSFLLPTLKIIYQALNPLIPYVTLKVVIDAFFTLIDRIHFHFTLEYSTYFILGYALMNASFSRKQLIGIGILSVAGFLSTFFITQLISTLRQVPINLYSNMTLYVLLESVGVFLFAKELLSRWGSSQLIRFISSHTLGIYMIHYGLIKIMRHNFGISTLSFHQAFSVPILVLFIYLVSLGLAVLLSKIPGLRRIV